MKDIVYFYIGLTTLVLVTVTIMATMNFPFNWVFYTTVLGQVLVIFMVYKVLRDKYTTTKTFEDFYEDHPIREQEHYR
jgi:TRAP-type C4-dicarboxylate transport system permease small subunit